MKLLNLSNKIDKLKEIESTFQKNQLNDLIIEKLKHIMQFKNNIKLDDLENIAKKVNL